MSLIEFIRLKTQQFVLQSVALCPGPVVWASVRDFSLLKRGVESHALLLGEAWAKHWKEKGVLKTARQYLAVKENHAGAPSRLRGLLSPHAAASEKHPNVGRSLDFGCQLDEKRRLLSK